MKTNFDTDWSFTTAAEGGVVIRVGPHLEHIRDHRVSF